VVYSIRRDFYQKSVPERKKKTVKYKRDYDEKLILRDLFRNEDQYQYITRSLSDFVIYRIIIILRV